jgi:hypothetical protein
LQLCQTILSFLTHDSYLKVGALLGHPVTKRRIRFIVIGNDAVMVRFMVLFSLHVHLLPLLHMLGRVVLPLVVLRDALKRKIDFLKLLSSPVGELSFHSILALVCNPAIQRIVFILCYTKLPFAFLNATSISYFATLVPFPVLSRLLVCPILEQEDVQIFL